MLPNKKIQLSKRYKYNSHKEHIIRIVEIGQIQRVQKLPQAELTNLTLKKRRDPNAT